MKSDLSFDPPKDCNRFSIEIKKESKNILYFWFQSYYFITNKQKLTYLPFMINPLDSRNTKKTEKSKTKPLIFFVNAHISVKNFQKRSK